MMRRSWKQPKRFAASHTMRRPSAAALCCCFVLCLLPIDAAFARGGTAGSSLAPLKDNTLIERENGSRSDGAGPAIRVGRSGDPEGGLRRALLDFDVSGQLPSAAVVLTATLSLARPPQGGDATPSVEDVEALALHRLQQDWGEGISSATGGQGAPATADDATWIHTFYDPESPRDSATWATPGGDYESLGIPISSWDEQFEIFTWTGVDLVADLQSWIDAPETEFGWVLLADESTINSAIKFASREAAQGLRPQLQLTYYLPEPATSCTFASVFATLAALRRRARIRHPVHTSVHDSDST